MINYQVIHDFINSFVHKNMSVAVNRRIERAFGLVLLVLWGSVASFSCDARDQKHNKKIREIDSFLKKNTRQKIENKKFVIKKIVVEGNKHTPTRPIRKRITYKPGDIFDTSKSNEIIHNLYGMGRFTQIKLEAEINSDDTVTIYVVVEEKKLLENLDITGNKSIKTKTIKEKLNLGQLSTIDEERLHHIAQAIKKLYREENRHFVTVKTKLVPNKKNPDKAITHIVIDEGPKSSITRVEFKGNKHIPDRKLRGRIFTRENWLLSFTDGAGAYNPQEFEMDKSRLEYFYRDSGYLMAKVTKTEIDFSESKRDVSVAFHINEGQQFVVRSVSAPGDEIYSEDELLPLITLEEGEPYSQTKLSESLNNLKDLWGLKGYIYADVYPQVKPDEKTNEVDIVFHVERGKILYANRVIITGNKTTRDKVIRRQLDISEGELITTRKLQNSKASVEYLSFFKRDGVNWKLHRISENQADLEMNVSETKTGSLNFQVSYGSDQQNSERSLRGMVQLEKKNLLGLGWDIGGSLQANRHRLKKLEAHFFDPYLFDSDVSGAFSIYKRWDEYDQWGNTLNRTPIQKVFGGNIRLGFGLPQIDKRMKLILDVGLENIRFNSKHDKPRTSESLLKPIIDRTFQEGTLGWLGVDLIKDTRNHQVYPNKGYKLILSTKTGLPGIDDRFGFFKAEAHASAYTALIGVDSLVLGMQFKMGHVDSLGTYKDHDLGVKKSRIIPYKELFHMGGQTTVRGHTWGGIGPAWGPTGSPLGAKNFIQFNTELIFPLLPDYSMKAHFFYDTGAGWDTPDYGIDDTNKRYVNRNKFDLRHTVGFGVNLMQPMPAKIDWGFKLDRKPGESAHEFHLTMNYAW